ncbi:MAG: transglycosylase domain-containing protein, partial [Terrimicrobiaceae bacterium]|nr:transglycosylase domain-containing protein [Terrimicrobiaceae bacterium]
MRRALAAALAGLSSLLAVAAAWWVLAAPAPPLPQPPRTTLVLDARGGELLTWGPPGCRDSRPLPIERLGPMIVSATLAVEDRRFFQHPGID